MGRIRTIKPEFWTSQQIGECAPLTRLFFIGLWNFCDDMGRHPANPAQLRALIFPYDRETSVNIPGMLTELASKSLIELYTGTDSRAYLWVTGWRHQKINRPQTPKHPPPPGQPHDWYADKRKQWDRGKFSEHSLTIHGRSPEHITQNPEPRDIATTSLVDESASTHVVARKSKQEANAKLQSFGEAWNVCAARCRLPQIDEIKAGSARERAAVARLEELHGDFDPLIAKVAASEFLRGENGHGFHATFDWIIKPSNFQKIMENNYENRKKPNGSWSPRR
jgi:hypothetical protein